MTEAYAKIRGFKKGEALSGESIKSYEAMDNALNALKAITDKDKLVGSNGGSLKEISEDFRTKD